jgi:tetratricopeptide (TPR) repeat protein
VIRKIREIAAHASEILSAPVQSDSSRGGHFYHATEPVKYFVPRVSLENQIKRRLHDTVAKRETSPKVLTIYGLGGAGKSQLVLSYVRTFRRDYSSVFIIDASTKASIELDYQQIYRRLHDPKASETIDVDQAINAFKSWFDGRDERCLVVFDSADNMHDSHAADFFKLDRYLPTSSYLDVIITTRPQPTKGFSELEAIEVAELSSEEGVQLFLSYSGTKVVTSEVTEEVTKIVTKLGHFALAITLAGAWVAATPHKGIKDYLPAYRKRRSAFLRQKADSNAHQYGESVFTAWEMSYEAVSEQCPAAANMLSFLAFLDNSDILLQLLDTPTYGPDGKSPASDPGWPQIISPDMPLEDVMDEVFSTLAKYSLVKWNNDTGSYSMHNLVHAWGHDRLAVQARAKYGAAALECLATTDLGIDPNPMPRARLIPHIMANFSTIPGWFDAMEDTKESTLDGVRSLADSLRMDGLYAFEEDLRVFELEKREDLSPEDDPELFRAMSDLAVVLRQLGMYEEATKLHRRCLEGRERVLGKEDPDTLSSVNNLAVVLQIQGDLDAAEKLYRRAVEGSEKILGNEHRNTLSSVDNLAVVLQSQGDLDAAEKLCRRALEEREKILGNEHRDTLMSVSNLAAVLQDQGDLDAAVKLCRRALEEREKILGKEHPATLTSVHNLASVLQSQGEYIAAEERLRQALEGKEKVLGKQHPDTLRSVWYLAYLMDRLGRTSEAILLYERAVAGFGAVLGSDHPDTMRCEQALRELQQETENAQELDDSPAR